MDLLLKIVSGGQTGVDRAALDFAIKHRIPHGGWCPYGRKAEDGQISQHYHLNVHPSPFYVDRTEQNVIDSHGTLIIYDRSISQGSAKTHAFCQRHRKPILMIKAKQLSIEESAHKLQAFVSEKVHAVLNVAGPRASLWPGGYDYTQRLLSVWQQLATAPNTDAPEYEETNKLRSEV